MRGRKPPPSPPAGARQPARLWIVLAATALAAATLAAYWPSLTGGFIWDDELLLTKNPLVHAADGLYRMWCTTEPIDYWPLTNTSFWLEWRLWGMNPIGYHVTNLVLHVGSAFLVWAILRRLRIPGAFLAALFFVLHPMNVESVAWIAQRKNTLSLFLFLLSVLWYVKDDEDAAPAPSGRRRAGYALSLLAFVLAMLSKGSVVVLPLVLLLIIWWRRDRMTRRDLARLSPFLVVAVALTLVNIWFQTHGGEEIRHATLLQRVLGAGAVVWFYLYKALLPIHLSFVYPQWVIATDELRWWLPLLACVAVTVLLVWQRRTSWGRPALFAWAFFCLALLPVMGFADVYFMKYSLVADHYSYIALIGVSAAAAAAIEAGLSYWSRT